MENNQVLDVLNVIQKSAFESSQLENSQSQNLRDQRSKLLGLESVMVKCQDSEMHGDFGTEIVVYNQSLELPGVNYSDIGNDAFSLSKPFSFQAEQSYKKQIQYLREQPDLLFEVLAQWNGSIPYTVNNNLPPNVLVPGQSLTRLQWLLSRTVVIDVLSAAFPPQLRSSAHYQLGCGAPQFVPGQAPAQLSFARTFLRSSQRLEPGQCKNVTICLNAVFLKPLAAAVRFPLCWLGDSENIADMDWVILASTICGSKGKNVCVSDNAFPAALSAFFSTCGVSMHTSNSLWSLVAHTIQSLISLHIPNDILYVLDNDDNHNHKLRSFIDASNTDESNTLPASTTDTSHDASNEKKITPAEQVTVDLDPLSMLSLSTSSNAPQQLQSPQGVVSPPSNSMSPYMDRRGANTLMEDDQKRMAIPTSVYSSLMQLIQAPCSSIPYNYLPNVDERDALQHGQYTFDNVKTVVDNLYEALQIPINTSTLQDNLDQYRKWQAYGGMLESVCVTPELLGLINSSPVSNASRRTMTVVHCCIRMLINIAIGAVTYSQENRVINKANVYVFTQKLEMAVKRRSVGMISAIYEGPAVDIPTVLDGFFLMVNTLIMPFIEYLLQFQAPTTYDVCFETPVLTPIALPLNCIYVLHHMIQTNTTMLELQPELAAIVNEINTSSNIVLPQSNGNRVVVLDVGCDAATSTQTVVDQLTNTSISVPELCIYTKELTTFSSTLVTALQLIPPINHQRRLIPANASQNDILMRAAEILRAQHCSSTSAALLEAANALQQCPVDTSTLLQCTKEWIDKKLTLIVNSTAFAELGRAQHAIGLISDAYNVRTKAVVELCQQQQVRRVLSGLSNKVTSLHQYVRTNVLAPASYLYGHERVRCAARAASLQSADEVEKNETIITAAYPIVTPQQSNTVNHTQHMAGTKAPAPFVMPVEGPAPLAGLPKAVIKELRKPALAAFTNLPSQQISALQFPSCGGSFPVSAAQDQYGCSECTRRLEQRQRILSMFITKYVHDGSFLQALRVAPSVALAKRTIEAQDLMSNGGGGLAQGIAGLVGPVNLGDGSVNFLITDYILANLYPRLFLACPTADSRFCIDITVLSRVFTSFHSFHGFLNTPQTNEADLLIVIPFLRQLLPSMVGSAQVLRTFQTHLDAVEADLVVETQHHKKPSSCVYMGQATLELSIAHLHGFCTLFSAKAKIRSLNALRSTISSCIQHSGVSNLDQQQLNSVDRCNALPPAELKENSFEYQDQCKVTSFSDCSGSTVYGGFIHNHDNSNYNTNTVLPSLEYKGIDANAGGHGQWHWLSSDHPSKYKTDEHAFNYGYANIPVLGVNNPAHAIHTDASREDNMFNWVGGKQQAGADEQMTCLCYVLLQAKPLHLPSIITFTKALMPGVAGASKAFMDLTVALRALQNIADRLRSALIKLQQRIGLNK